MLPSSHAAACGRHEERQRREIAAFQRRRFVHTFTLSTGTGPWARQSRGRTPRRGRGSVRRTKRPATRRSRGRTPRRGRGSAPGFGREQNRESSPRPQPALSLLDTGFDIIADRNDMAHRSQSRTCSIASELSVCLVYRVLLYLVGNLWL